MRSQPPRPGVGALGACEGCLPRPTCFRRSSAGKAFAIGAAVQAQSLVRKFIRQQNPLQTAQITLSSSLLFASASSSPPRRGKGLPPRTSNRSPNDFGAPERRVTDILLGLNVLTFGLQLATGQALTVWGAKHNPSIAAGQWWRLITPALLHGNLVHLAVNSQALNNLGPLVERVSGRWRFLSVYTLSALGGTACSYALSPSLSVGASGAIFGVGGAMAVFFARHRDFFGDSSDAILRQLGQGALLNLGLGLAASNIDNWGHLGGLIAGALASYLLGPRLVRDRLQLRDKPPIPLFATRPVDV